jgi:hypothetical protein
MNKVILWTLIILLIIVLLIIIYNIFVDKLKHAIPNYLKDKLKEFGLTDELISDIENEIRNLIKNAHKVPFIADLKNIDLDSILLIVKEKAPGIINKENYTISGDTANGSLSPVNLRLWPYYFYTDPYLPDPVYPENLYTRLRYWYPGFLTSGWSYTLRPDISNVRSQRNRWVRDNNNYYFINNSGYD